MSRELQNRLNLFARHAEFFHQLVNAHILKVLEHSGDRRPSAFKHPRTAALPGMLSFLSRFGGGITRGWMTRSVRSSHGRGVSLR